jgi:hypothetical protein
MLRSRLILSCSVQESFGEVLSLQKEVISLSPFSHLRRVFLYVTWAEIKYLPFSHILNSLHIFLSDARIQAFLGRINTAFHSACVRAVTI